MKLLTTKTEDKLTKEIDSSQNKLSCIKETLENHASGMYDPLRVDCLKMIEDINHSLYILRKNI